MSSSLLRLVGVLSAGLLCSVLGCANINVAGEQGGDAVAGDDIAEADAEGDVSEGIPEDGGDSSTSPDATEEQCEDWVGGLWQMTTRNVDDQCFGGKLGPGTFIRNGLDYFGWGQPLTIPAMLPAQPVDLVFHPEERFYGVAECVSDDVIVTASLEDMAISDNYPGCEGDANLRLTFEVDENNDLQWTIVLTMTDWDEECGSVQSGCFITLTGDGF